MPRQLTQLQLLDLADWTRKNIETLHNVQLSDAAKRYKKEAGVDVSELTLKAVFERAGVRRVVPSNQGGAGVMAALRKNNRVVADAVVEIMRNLDLKPSNELLAIVADEPPKKPTETDA